MIEVAGKATVYVCQNYACQAQVNDVAERRKLIETSSQGSRK